MEEVQTVATFWTAETITALSVMSAIIGSFVTGIIVPRKTLRNLELAQEEELVRLERVWNERLTRAELDAQAWKEVASLEASSRKQLTDALASSVEQGRLVSKLLQAFQEAEKEVTENGTN